MVAVAVGFDRSDEPDVDGHDILGRAAWQADAACQEHPEISWFPERGESTAPAKAVCAGCLVKSECLEAALGERFGIWGGKSERERRKIRKARAAERPQPAPTPARPAVVRRPKRSEVSPEAQRLIDERRLLVAILVDEQNWTITGIGRATGIAHQRIRHDLNAVRKLLAA